MVNRDLVAAKLADLGDKVSRVGAHCPATAAELGADRDALDLVSFNLMLAMQICSDVASHLIADEGWSPAKNLGEAFVRLREHQVISPGTADALGRAVGLRNVVAHGDAGVDSNMVHLAASRGVADLDAFAREVAAWVTATP